MRNRFRDLKDRINWQIVLGLIVIIVLILISYFVINSLLVALITLWNSFQTLDKTIAASMIAGVFTVITATITVFVGRYYEDKRKRAELHREKKIEMYDIFIGEIFKVFANAGSSQSDEEKTELIDFLREYQRQFLLWSNAGVIRAFSEWQRTLKNEANAQSIIGMEKFFLAVRKDLGHSNWGIKKGDTVRFLLRHTDFFLEQIKTNPNVTLEQLAKMEKDAGLK